MKLLKFMIKNYKLLDETFTFSLVPSGNKSMEDKEYELSEIAPELFVFNTIGIVGKNASGKTTTIETLDIVYDILSNFKIKNSKSCFSLVKGVVSLEIYFYHDNKLYFYKTKLENNVLNDYVKFLDEEIYVTPYYKSYAADLFNLDRYKKIDREKNIPDDTSMIYYVLNDIIFRGDCYNDKAEFVDCIDKFFELYKTLDKKNNILNATISLLDEHINSITMIDNDDYVVELVNGENEEMTRQQLYGVLSSGTKKGLYLYANIIISLMCGTDYGVDEIEVHFHKTLVENLINLYKDKRINKKGATLIFTSHYPELLDLFERSDNIYICHYDKSITIDTAYNYNLRSDAIKSKKFYENAFGTSINYEALMAYKKKLLDLARDFE